MAFRLICVAGPREGEEFLVKDAITLGRKEGDLQLQDEKASNRHAKIFSDPKGLIYIEDLGSSNGTFVNGVRIKDKTEIKIGDKLGLGRTTFEVVEAASRNQERSAEAGSWQESVETAFKSAMSKAESVPRPNVNVEAFNDPITLEFVQGVQTGTKMIFGFGPRQVGAHCNDALLFEENAPAVAFELRPVKDGLCEFRTKEDSVCVNGNPVNVQKLKNGDRISLGRTVIVVTSK